MHGPLRGSNPPPARLADHPTGHRKRTEDRRGGQTLLSLDFNGNGELFTGAGLAPTSSAGGVDSYAVPMANDPALAGLCYFSQAIQFGSPPFELSNAQDLTIGGF